MSSKVPGESLVAKMRELGVHLSKQDELVVKEMVKTGDKSVDSFLGDFCSFVSKEANTLTPREQELYNKAIVSNPELFEDSPAALPCASLETKLRLDIKLAQLELQSLKLDVKREAKLLERKRRLKIYQADKVNSLKRNLKISEEQFHQVKNDAADVAQQLQETHSKIKTELTGISNNFESIVSKLSVSDAHLNACRNVVEHFEENLEKKVFSENFVDAFGNSAERQKLRQKETEIARVVKNAILRKCKAKAATSKRRSKSMAENDLDNLEKLIAIQEQKLGFAAQLYAKSGADKQLVVLYKKQVAVEDKYITELREYQNRFNEALSCFCMTQFLLKNNEDLLANLFSIYEQAAKIATVDKVQTKKDNITLKLWQNRLKELGESEPEQRYGLLGKLELPFPNDRLKAEQNLRKHEKHSKAIAKQMQSQVNVLKCALYGRHIMRPILMPQEVALKLRQVELVAVHNHDRLMRIKSVKQKQAEQLKGNTWLDVRHKLWIYYLCSPDKLTLLMKKLKEEVQRKRSKSIDNLRLFLMRDD